MLKAKRLIQAIIIFMGWDKISYQYLPHKLLFICIGISKKPILRYLFAIERMMIKFLIDLINLKKLQYPKSISSALQQYNPDTLNRLSYR